MCISFPEMSCFRCLTIIWFIMFSANAGIINPSRRHKLYNVMLLEADLKTPEQCEKTKWASNQASEMNAYGFWFCKGSLLGRLVDQDFFANVQKAELVHYVARSRAHCEDNGSVHTTDHDVYIFLGNSKNDKLNIIEEHDERATNNEFVQHAISVLEMEEISSCSSELPALNISKWGWELLSGVDF